MVVVGHRSAGSLRPCAPVSHPTLSRSLGHTQHHHNRASPQEPEAIAAGFKIPAAPAQCTLPMRSKIDWGVAASAYQVRVYFGSVSSFGARQEQEEEVPVLLVKQ